MLSRSPIASTFAWRHALGVRPRQRSFASVEPHVRLGFDIVIAQVVDLACVAVLEVSDALSK
jgi:hypothetical protein